MRCLLFLFFLGCSASSVVAQPYQTEFEYLEDRWRHTVQMSPADALGLIRAVELSVDDQVDGGCWTNVSAVRARIRAELERSNIAVFSEPLAQYSVLSPHLSFRVLGYRVNSGLCVGHAAMRVSYRGETEMGSVSYVGTIFEFFAPAIAWERSSIFSSSSLDEQALSTANEWVDVLVGDVAAARRDTNVRAFEEVWHQDIPATQAEFDAEMARVVERVTAEQ